MLMGTLVALMLASPLADRDRRVGGVLAFAQLLLLFVGASYLANRHIVRRVVVPIAVVWLFARLVEAFGDSRHAIHTWRHSQDWLSRVRSYGLYWTGSVPSQE